MMPSHDASRRRIGLLGGSFNPAHAGHRQISVAALDRLGLEAVWWLVTPGNPLKDAGQYAPYEERLTKARAVAAHPDIVVSDFERRHNLQYTVDTLERLQITNPDIDFIWLMGADSLAGFHRWKDWRKIAELAPMAVFNRPGYTDNALSGQAAKALDAFRIDEENLGQLTGNDPPVWVYFSDTDNPLSSTEIRNNASASTGKPSGDTHNVTDITAPYGPLAFFLDLHPDIGDFKADALAGLAQPQKTLSPKYFYDERGSKLFQRITTLEEYYPTSTEKAVFDANAAAITDKIGSGAAIFEYGSGASEKIAWLLDGLDRPAAYVAMDISKDYLIESATALAGGHSLPVAAVCADFHAPVTIPAGHLPQSAHWLGFFPGSTLGNMQPDSAVDFLTRASQTLGPDAKFLLGIDLEKDPAILHAAYNDRDGVTAQFNLNLLTRMQRELGAILTISDFEHYAFYSKKNCRIEMHLRALRPTSITIDEQKFTFAAGETLYTENSYKYSPSRLAALFAQTPWRQEAIWTDEKGWFAACLLSNS
jgi:L-histidine Nalpha-methyltransferase